MYYSTLVLAICEAECTRTVRLTEEVPVQHMSGRTHRPGILQRTRTRYCTSCLFHPCMYAHTHTLRLPRYILYARTLLLIYSLVHCYGGPSSGRPEVHTYKKQKRMSTSDVNVHRDLLNLFYMQLHLLPFARYLIFRIQIRVITTPLYLKR